MAPEPARDLAVTDQEWVATLYPQLQQEAGWLLEFRFLEDRPGGPKRPPVSTRFLRDPEEIATHLHDHRERSARQASQGLQDGHWPAALFWGVQPRLARRGRSQDVAALVALTCDLDCKDLTDVPESERPRSAWSLLFSAAAKPSVAVWTGHGFHAYWLLREPQLDKTRGEEIQRAMAHQLRGDHIWDCARLLRWPNSVNYKGLEKNQCEPVRLVWWRPELRYEFADLAGCFRNPSPPQSPARSANRAMWKRFFQCLDCDSSLRALWEGRADGLEKDDRSRLDMALAHALTRHQLTPDAFAALAAAAPWNCQKTLTASYLQRTWEKAKPTVKAQPPPPTCEFLSSLPESAWTPWARLYREAVGASTEAADELHYVALLTIVGAALGRSITVFCGRPLHPNIYAMLIGPTGDRKSTAAELALDLLRRTAPDVLLLNGVGSQEGLMERMAGLNAGKDSRTLLFVDEMAALLKKGRRESSGSLIEFITELFHAPDSKVHFTRAKAIHLVNPTLNILAASTPAWLEAALDEEDILGGFTNRFIYATGSAKPDNPLPVAPDQSKMDRLAEWIRKISQAPPRSMVWRLDARKLWCDFYMDWRRFVTGQGERAAALLRRSDLYILKFASINAAMDETTEITPAHLAPAIDLGRFLAGCAHQTLGDLGAPRDYRIERLIEQKLVAANGSMRRKHLRQVLGGRVTGEKLDRILRAMERNGLISLVLEPSGKNLSHVVKLTS